MAHEPNPIRLPDSAPRFIQDLRIDFEGRMFAFHEYLSGIPVAYTADGLERTSHVHFTHGTLDVAAVFSHIHGRFTQLIARDVSEPYNERPSYTISIFL
jgi:hypothetical protein